nr:hypothetical protein Iba_chr12aCG11260 [Ipomoea batatas]
MINRRWNENRIGLAGLGSTTRADLTRAFFQPVVLGHIEVVKALVPKVEEMRPRPQNISPQGRLKCLREKDNFGLLEEVISTV